MGLDIAIEKVGCEEIVMSNPRSGAGVRKTV